MRKQRLHVKVTSSVMIGHPFDVNYPLQDMRCVAICNPYGGIADDWAAYVGPAKTMDVVKVASDGLKLSEAVAVQIFPDITGWYNG